MSEKLFKYLKEKETEIVDFLKADETKEYFKPQHIYDGVISYVFRPAKRLRPSILLMACGCTVGEERESLAIPAAAGVEVYHAWTLVHDDIIDNDNLRRGGPTIHKLMETAGKAEMRLSEDIAKDYGRDIAILAGDVQHAWAVKLFTDCSLKNGVDPLVTLEIIKYLESYMLGNLIKGETLDVQFSLAESTDMTDIDESKVIEMLWLKTGILYEFSGMSGAMIGKNSSDLNDPQVTAVKNFAGNCGIAFQLQDDLLGVLGNEKVLGKPIGSDIREGKKTTIVLEALKNADEAQRSHIVRTLGNKNASEDDIKKVVHLFNELNGIGHTKKMAEDYIQKALPHLDIIPPSKYKDLLLEWADFMINREF